VLESGPDDPGERLDRWISERLDLSRTRVQRLIADGQVFVDGAVPTKSDPVEPDSRVEIRVPPPEPARAEPEDIPVPVVYEDHDLLVVDKPAGMVVHPAPGHPGGTLVNALLYQVGDLSGIGGERRPGIVHRLDRYTSGLLVVAKNDQTHHALSDALRRRRVKRLYIAAVWGHLSESPIEVDEPIGRSRKDRKRMAVATDGRSAVTRMRVRERWAAAEVLDVALGTGRTHQIRVHAAHIGHPVVGDGLYGPGWERGMSGPDLGWARELAKRVTRQFLHATRLAFVHPSTGVQMRFDSPLPEDLDRVAVWARESLSS